MREVVAVVAFLGFLLLGLWSGAGLGLQSCAAAGDHGYAHSFFMPGVKVYCRIENPQ